MHPFFLTAIIKWPPQSSPVIVGIEKQRENFYFSNCWGCCRHNDFCVQSFPLSVKSSVQYSAKKDSPHV